ncbi:MAG: hypothetical protein ACO3FI_02405 [Cyclobacteriaceae bacterium]
MKKHTVVLFAALIAFIASSCSFSVGSIVPSSHYVYPNSNVTPMGQTTATFSRMSILFPPKFTSQDSESLFSQALSRYPGSDVVIDYKTDTKLTQFPVVPLWKLEITVTGTAAKMEVGKQDIGKGK